MDTATTTRQVAITAKIRVICRDDILLRYQIIFGDDIRIFKTIADKFASLEGLITEVSR